MIYCQVFLNCFTMTFIAEWGDRSVGDVVTRHVYVPDGFDSTPPEPGAEPEPAPEPAPEEDMACE